jgi:hypothetical protein
VGKAVIKMAEALLDRFFREAEGSAGRPVDLVFAVADLGFDGGRADVALRYLEERGLIRLGREDEASLTDRGVKAVLEEWPIVEMLPEPRAEETAASISESDRLGAPADRPKVPLLRYEAEDSQTYHEAIGWMATIGRADDNTLQIDDLRASKHHAKIRYLAGHYVIEDLGAANGTLVNGAYADSRVLEHGDEIVIGRTRLVFLCPSVLLRPQGEPPRELGDISDYVRGSVPREHASNTTHESLSESVLDSDATQSEPGFPSDPLEAKTVIGLVPPAIMHPRTFDRPETDSAPAFHLVSMASPMPMAPMTEDTDTVLPIQRREIPARNETESDGPETEMRQLERGLQSVTRTSENVRTFLRLVGVIRTQVDQSNRIDRKPLLDALDLLARHPYVRLSLSLDESE